MCNEHSCYGVESKNLLWSWDTATAFNFHLLNFDMNKAADDCSLSVSQTLYLEPHSMLHSFFIVKCLSSTIDRGVGCVCTSMNRLLLLLIGSSVARIIEPWPPCVISTSYTHAWRWPYMIYIRTDLHSSRLHLDISCCCHCLLMM